jgi:hypothetical protein
VDVTRQPYGGGGNRDWTFSDRGLRPDPFCSSVGGLHKRLQFRTDHPGLACDPMAGLDLAKHLRLADHLAVEGRSNAEDLFDGALILKHIGLGI